MPIVRMGRLRMGENPDRGFSLSTPRDYRGRVGAAIPSGGIILKGASGGMAPITHSITNLPSGLSFNAGTRAITGTPSAAHATRAVVLTATDSSTPAEVVTATFQFPVVSTTAALTRDDWDNRGYGLETRTTYILALLQGTVNVGSANVIVWRQPPSGSTIGLLLDEDGNATADFSDMTFTADGASIFVSRMDFLVSQDRVEFREATTPDVHFGSYLSTTLGAPNLYLRTLDDGEQTLSWDRGFGGNGQWRRSSPDIGAFLQTLDSGVRYLLAVAST